MKSFIIHLSKILSSKETAYQTKEDLKKYGIESELWEGTYGNDPLILKENRPLHPWTFKGPNAPVVEDSKYAQKASALGVKGCFYSHFRLWEKCIELDEPIMIWEDDIEIRRGYIPVEWDDILVLAIGHPAKSSKYLEWFENPDIENPKSIIFGNASMPGCCGYAIKPHAAKTLVTTYANTYLPADNAINKHIVKIEIHTCIMGRAKVGKSQGKKSLTRATADYWRNLNL